MKRITTLYIDLNFLQTKPRFWYKICLLTHKAIQYKEPLCLNELFQLKKTSTINLQSKHDTWKFIEHRVPGSGSPNRCFKCCAPRLYRMIKKMRPKTKFKNSSFLGTDFLKQGRVLILRLKNFTLLILNYSIFQVVNS